MSDPIQSTAYIYANVAGTLLSATLRTDMQFTHYIKMKFTPLVAVMSITALLLLCLMTAYQMDLFYYGQIKRYAQQEYGMFIPDEDFTHRPLFGCEIPEVDDIHTHFFHVEITQHVVPTPDVNGGGMASDEGVLYLLTGSGQIFQVMENRIVDTNIKVPDNNNGLYQNRMRTGDVAQSFSAFRYNDIAVKDGAIYVSYVEWHDKQTCYTQTVAKYEDEEWSIFYRSSPCLPGDKYQTELELIMSGGRMDFYREGLLLTTGDFTTNGDFPPGSSPRSDSSDYGKVLLLGIDSPTVEVISKGHRNPQGITVDRHGRIWSVEHGPRGGDELNLIMPGHDYGWPSTTLGTNYDSTPVRTAGEFGRHGSHTPPIYSWIPSRGVSNLIEINGFHPAWDGDLLVATMGAERLYRVRATDRASVLFSEPICIGRRSRYIHQHTDGKIYVWTDDQVLYRISRPLKPALPATMPQILNQCQDCHSAEGGGAPSLAEIKARNSTSRIKQYLRAPQSVDPNSKMPNLNLTPGQIDQIVKAIESI